MAINMGLTLFVHMLVLLTVHCLIPEENLSKENINEILDKLILQTQQINETAPNADIQDLTPIVETQPGNDSNIYYIKTVMPPNINFKSSSEIINDTRHSNKTDQSHEVANDAHNQTPEDEDFPGASKITRKASNLKQFIPRHIQGGQESVYSEIKVRSGNVGENDYLLNDLIKKEIASELNTTNRMKQISFTNGGHQNQQLSILHQYPEIIIDHITYDNDENDKNKKNQIKSVHDAQHVQNVAKVETNSRLPIPPPPKIRYNIPEEEIEIEDHEPPEHFETRNYFTPEVNGLIDAIIQKRVVHDALLKQTTENESRKQSKLLEKILQRLPEKRPMTNNVKSSYTLRRERIAPVAMEMRSAPEIHLNRNGGNHLTKSYLNVPLRPSKWEIHNHLMNTLMRMYRPDILKRTRVVAGLIDRIVPNVDYRPAYYDLYKK